MTLWSIARSPLVMGGNMPKNDDFTLSLMTNDEVIAVNQRSANNKQVFARNNNTQYAWLADVPGSKDKYLAIFNASPAPVGGRFRGRGTPAPKTAPAVVDPTATQPAKISVSLADIGLAGPCKVRDLWAHKDLDAVSESLSVTVNSHGAVLYRVQPQTDPPAAEQSQPASTNIPGAEYPRIHSDLRVTFRLKAPDAHDGSVTPGQRLQPGPWRGWLLDRDHDAAGAGVPLLPVYFRRRGGQ